MTTAIGVGRRVLRVEDDPGGPGAYAEQMGASARWRHEVAEHPQLVDVVLAVAVLVASIIQPGESGDRRLELTPGGAALVVLACSALVVRRRWPVPVLLVTLFAALAYMVVVGAKSPIGLAVAIAGFTVALSTDRRTVLWGCSATVVIGAGVVTAGSPGAGSRAAGRATPRPAPGPAGSGW